jgi:hypothetical protein
LLNQTCLVIAAALTLSLTATVSAHEDVNAAAASGRANTNSSDSANADTQDNSAAGPGTLAYTKRNSTGDNFYQGMGPHGGMPVAKVPMPTEAEPVAQCHIQSVMTDADLELCRRDARR